MSRLRTLLSGRDRGFTLAEVSITVVILGVVLAGVQTALIMTQRTVSDQSVRVDQTQQGRVAIESVTKILRTAVLPSQLNATCTGCSDLAAFIQGTPKSVQFYANINNDRNIVGPSRVTYTVNSSNELVETMQAPNPHAADDFNYQYCTPGPGCVVSTRVLARNMVPSQAGVHVLRQVSATRSGTGTLDATKLALVDSVDVVISTKLSPTSRVPGDHLHVAGFPAQRRLDRSGDRDAEPVTGVGMLTTIRSALRRSSRCRGKTRASP